MLFTRHQRYRLISLDFVPTDPRADLVKPWRSLLTDENTPSTVGRVHATTTNSVAVMAWLNEVLLIASALLREARIPIFDPLLALNAQQISQSSDSGSNIWRATLQVPVLEHIPSSNVEPVITAALKASIALAAWVQQLASGSSADEGARAQFFSKIESKILKGLRQLVPTIGKSTLNVLRACHAQGIPWADLGKGIYQMGWGVHGRRIDRSTTDKDSVIGMRVARDKSWTARWLRAAGLPAAEHELVNNLADAHHAAARLGWPAVIKPADAERGEGVHVDVQPSTLSAAFEAAQKCSPSRNVLVERQVNGVCHRLFIAQNRLLYAVRRLPMGVYGNGKDSVETLVYEAWKLQQKLPPWQRSPMCTVDDLARTELQRQSLLPTSTPAADRFVALRRIETTAWGGVDEDVSDSIHPDNLHAALEASKLIGLEIAGIDFISVDISQPWHSNGAVINEVNYAPLLGEGAISKQHVSEFVAGLITGNGRIPVEVFVGDAAAAEAARQKAAQLHEKGMAIMVTSHDWTQWGDGRKITLTADGLYARTRAMILSPSLEAMILVVQNDELSYIGLPLEGVDRVHIINDKLSCKAVSDAFIRKKTLMNWLADWVW
jgi:D-alanine-D-alanine ligase-like ATP-grasp enzyme